MNNLIVCIVIYSDCNNCIWCKRLLYSIRKKSSKINIKKNIRTYFSPQKKAALQRLQNVKKSIKKQYSRATIRIKRLEQNLNDIKNQMKSIDETSLNSILENTNISKCQTELIREIFSAAKVKNSKSRRYNENWMLLCLLFQIRLEL